MAANERTRLRRDLNGSLAPLDAHARLRRFRPLLLDGMGLHPEARHAYLALSPEAEHRIRGDRLITDGKEVARGPPAELLRGVLDTCRLDVAEPEGFTGGLVGYLGYEATRAFEPTLPAPKSDPGTPDVVLRLCPDVLVIDRHAGTMRLYAADADPGCAAARLDEYARALAQEPVPVAPLEPIEADWTTSLDQPDFEAAVRHLKDLIRDGDLFQANLATRFRTPCDAAPEALFAALAAANPSPYMALLDFQDHAIVSCSPEQLLAVQGGVLRTRPIAGTRRRGRDDAEDAAMETELLTDEKEQAEHTMLVDLLRNDVAKVSVPGTTRVAERMSVERYRHVMHLVSRVEGRVRPGTDVVDWLAAVFPGGTITGAPKHRACLRIHEAEPVPRGPYTGSAGYVSWSHNTHWNILIRTLVLQDGHATVHAGSGIVADSDPTQEWHEANHKAQALLDAACGRAGKGSTTRLGEVTRHGDWSPPAPSARVAARVLLVDNYDSFVHNLADYCALLGADVQVVRNDEDLGAARAAFRPTHLILGPGPGWPDDAGSTLDAARDLVGTLPILGVCLGHQALAQAHGGRVLVGPTIHGKTSPVLHDSDTILAGLSSPFEATRYHSLVVEPPPGWPVIARLDDGTVMAMRHPEHPVWGLQFHPESLCTDGGLETIRRFLEA